MDRFFGALKWSRELRQKIMRESGLPISFGLSVNKTVSKIATGEAKPNGALSVEEGRVRDFLNPLSIRKIPMLGKESYRKLRRMGIVHIKTLSEMPPELLQQVMGKNGLMLWKRANGIDHTPVHTYSERKSVSTERTFQQDSTDVDYLNDLLVSMTEKLAFELRKKEKLCSVVTVKIRYSNFDTHSMQQRVAYTSLDHALIPVVKELFRKLYTRRMLIRLIGVRLSGLIGGVYQLDLFDDREEQIRLYQAMDKIRKRYGSSIVHRAVF
jgi:DNA polymerase-4